MEAELVRATWGLVLATGLLVIGALIPVGLRIADWRKERLVRGVRIIPDLNILKSRLDGSVERLGDIERFDAASAEAATKDLRGQLEIVGDVVRQGSSLKMSNELFILRHLITQSRIELGLAAHMFDEDAAEQIRERDARIRRARHLCRAARVTVDSVEALAPKAARSINGEDFWTRFKRVSDEREEEAARALVAS